MTILASLVRAYDRLPDVAPYGYSSEKIGFVIGLREDGTVASVTDLRSGEGRKKAPRMMQVPQPAKRTVKIIPNLLWDKTSYALGVTQDAGERTAKEHTAFVERQAEVIGQSSDPGLRAFLAFLTNWVPEQFVPPIWPEGMRDQNIVFTLESDRLSGLFLHDRPAARALIAAHLLPEQEIATSLCLVSGVSAPIARLHPAIKNVWGAQSSGASIVSFNRDAFTSYGHEQGDNAPVSEAAAFKYTTALNVFLAGKSNRIQIGDASTVFWADASAADAAAAESIFAQLFGEPIKTNETTEAQKIGAILQRIRNGEVWSDVSRALSPGLESDVRFNVLGLAPNAARLSIRFWFEEDFGVLADNYRQFVEEMRIDPPPREPYPALWRYLVETAVLGKRENVQPNLAGDWMRSILNGTPYPLTLLSTVLMRIRADGDVNGLRAGMLKALLIRNFDKEVPVSLDPENTNKGYLLGRLFAAYEQAQTAALGRNVNATIKDKFYGSASATPRKVFAFLERGSANHLSKVGKERPGQRVNLEKTIGGIMAAMDPANDPFPTSLPAEDQALFGLGYYHQRGEFFRKTETTGTEDA
jgi:CRISPR-associated protein Csd1